jgi:branched-chain amino acid aminotransferase
MKLIPSRYVWFNGELVPWDKAQVHVLTHALHYGSGVFEGIRAYAAKGGTAVFGLPEHVQRLFQSCKIVDLPLRWSQDQVAAAIRETVRANEHEACYIRPLAYRGYGALGVWPEECPVELAIATFPWVKAGEKELLEKGVDVGVSSWRRMAPDTHPALAKATGKLRQQPARDPRGQAPRLRRGHRARRRGLPVRGQRPEPVRGPGGQAVDAAGGLLDPGRHHAQGGDRAGGTAGLAVIEQRLPRELLYTCDELFFTGTVAEITPIRSVDGKPVGTGARGPITARVQQRFYAIAHGEIEDRHAWLTRV